jgi:hypothetical protein
LPEELPERGLAEEPLDREPELRPEERDCEPPEREEPELRGLAEEPPEREEPELRGLAEEPPEREEPELRGVARGCDPLEPLRPLERGLAEGLPEREEPELRGVARGCDPLEPLRPEERGWAEEPVRSRVVRAPDILRYRSRTRSALCPSVLCRGRARVGSVELPDRSRAGPLELAPLPGLRRVERRVASPRPREPSAPSVVSLRG